VGISIGPALTERTNHLVANNNLKEIADRGKKEEKLGAYGFVCD